MWRKIIGVIGMAFTGNVPQKIILPFMLLMGMTWGGTVLVAVGMTAVVFYTIGMDAGKQQNEMTIESFSSCLRDLGNKTEEVKILEAQVTLQSCVEPPETVDQQECDENTVVPSGPPSGVTPAIEPPARTSCERELDDQRNAAYRLTDKLMDCEEELETATLERDGWRVSVHESDTKIRDLHNQIDTYRTITAAIALQPPALVRKPLISFRPRLPVP